MPGSGNSRIPRRAVRTLTDAVGRDQAAAILDRAAREAGRMLSVVDDRGSRAVHRHVTASIVPIAALYAALRADLDEERALEVTFAVMREMFRSRAVALRMLRRAPGRFTLFRWANRRALSRDFGAPGWDCEIVEDSPSRFAYTMRSCCFKEIFAELGVPEVAPLSCRIDDVEYSALPPDITFERTQTLANGDPGCDFVHRNLRRQ